MQQIRKVLPRCGGDNLWRTVQRFLALFKLTPIGRDRLARIVKQYGLKVGRRKSLKVQTTYSNHSYAVQPNLVPAVKVNAPGKLLVADITYIPLYRGHAYLFLITDAYSRKIVGHHLSRNLCHEGAVSALRMALKEIPNPETVVHHSDRGVQYCCHDFLDEIRRFKLQSSMTDKNHCAQNALAECINGILKTEFFLDVGFPTFEQAHKAVQQAIFVFNHLRIHGSLAGRTPAEVHARSGESMFELWGQQVKKCMAMYPYQDSLCVNTI